MARSVSMAVLLAALVVATVVPVGIAAAAETPYSHDGRDCSFPVTITDATGTEVTVSEQPDRVVVLGASAAQTTWELGAEDRVVGIDAFSTYLEGAESVPVVSGGIGRVDYEAALNQSPDLVIVAGNSYTTDVAAEFRRANVTTFAMPDAGSIEGVYNKTYTFGQLLGACGAAHQTVTDMRERVETVRAAVEGEEQPSVFVDFGGVRGESARYSSGPETFIGDLVATAGGANIVANGNFSTSFPQVSNEFILSQDPSWIIVTYTPGSSFGPSTPAEARAAVRNVSVFQETTAVEEGQIIAVNANNFAQPAPRLVLALETIVKQLHPEAYEAANQTTTTTTTVTSTQTTTQTTAAQTSTTAPTTSGDGGPGFGLLGAGVAIAVVAGLLLHRD
ncbi:MAG: PGF-CTERM-anchored ABC transporter substrate-binding protein [Halobacteriaceae archaeon]